MEPASFSGLYIRKAQNAHPLSAQCFDTNPYLNNCNNSIINLKELDVEILRRLIENPSCFNGRHRSMKNGIAAQNDYADLPETLCNIPIHKYKVAYTSCHAEQVKNLM